MAETKTNIPIEIKMGNAGTNNSNLPAFKEGSIIFTKDTKKIYIDPVGETERIAVGGGEVDLSGKQDVFSDVQAIYDGDIIRLWNFKYWDKATKDYVQKSGAKLWVTDILTQDVQFSDPSATGYIKLVSSSEPQGNAYIALVTNSGTELVRFGAAPRSSAETYFKNVEINNLKLTNVQDESTEEPLTLYNFQNGLALGNNIIIRYSNVMSNEGIEFTNVPGDNLVIRKVADGVNPNEAVNKKQLDTKQDKITKDTELSVKKLLVAQTIDVPLLHLGGDNGHSIYSPGDYIGLASNTGDALLRGLKTPVQSNDAANKKYVDDSITTQVSSVYKAKGSITDLTTLSTPDKAHEGFVYNIENEFITTDQFVEGAGKVYSAGTNVVCINTTGTTYKWDVLAGMVNLSDYVTTEDLANGLAGKQEMITTSTNLIAGTVTAEAGQYFLKINNQSIDFVDRLISFDHPSISITMSGYKAGSSVTPADVSFLCYPQLTTALQNPYVTLSNIANPTSNYQAANKKYVDDAIAASGGSSITIDSELSGTSTNPVQNKVINSALSNKLDKFTQPGVQWNGLLYGVQDDGTGHSIQKMFDLCTDAIKDTVVLRNKQGEILCETPTVNVTDKHAVNIGYLTTKYGPTNYSSQDKEFYLPSGSNLVIPNTEMGRLFMGSEGARSTDFKIYVNDPIDGGKLIITSLKTPTNDEDAVNKKYVDDIKTELLKAINHPYTYDETTKELTLIL